MRHWKSWRHGLCGALMGLLAFAGSPTMAGSLFGPSPQDDCVIGTVTRERYREIAAGVEALPPIPWDRVVAAATSGPNPVLTEYLRGILGPTEELDTKLATIHALLRQNNAEYTSVLISPNAPQAKSPLELRRLSFIYNVDTWSVGLWRPICRSSSIIVHFSMGDKQMSRKDLDFDYVALVIPSCFKTFSLYRKPAQSCILDLSSAVMQQRSTL